MPDTEDKTGGGTGETNPAPALAPRKTLGFTIENIADKLPDFGEDPLLLGWMFFFIKEKTTTNPNRDRIENIADIRMKEVRLVTNGRRSYQMVMNDMPDPYTITPLLHTQEEAPVFLPNVTEQTPDGPVIRVPNYDQCLSSTVSGYASPTDIDGPEAPLIVNLEEYQAWADAAYIRATDLRLLKTYLVNDAAGYDDVFFSGAELDYSTLHNARLRLEQRYLRLDPGILEDDGNGKQRFKDGKRDGKILDQTIDNDYYLEVGVAFTLKAEPILKTMVSDDEEEDASGANNDDNNPDDSNEPSNGDSDGSRATDNDDSGDTNFALSGEMMPGAFTLVNCPNTWTLMQALRDEAAVATGNPAARQYPVSATGDEDLDAMIQLLNETDPPTDPASATWLAQLLRDIADAIDRLFGTP